MREIITGRDIIVIGQQPWDTEIGSNCKNIALEFSKHNRVLYVNSPLDRITLLRHKNNEKVKKRVSMIKGEQENLIEIQSNLWNYYPDCLLESLNWINSTLIFSLLNKRNNKKLARSIKKAIKRLNFKDFILFNDNEILKVYYLKELLSPSISIYYSRDNMVAVDYWKKHGRVLEPKLIAKSDICVANSTFLTEYCATYNPDSYYVGQGCELDLFVKNDQLPLLPELNTARRPFIGYVGALQSIRLDMDILMHIASERPEWTIILVGPEDHSFANSKLHDFKNIMFVGLKPVEELPDYINFFDVCINPQLLNEVTIGNYPRKIDEYLAIGKPVVATATVAMKSFGDFVYLAETKADYIKLIEKALAEDSEELQDARRTFALEHTWENSVSQIYSAISLQQVNH
ncbi:glycosyltransferase [Pedobacter sp. AW31-3R]|uniref:glycosyltransferase n=1 Tax=Pedobacter sp. AW31-3R TaxID=3445781 RepID=UPI003F9ED83B